MAWSALILEEVGMRWWQKGKDTEVFLTWAQDYSNNRILLKFSSRMSHYQI